MNPQDQARKIIAEMFANDAFSQWLGIEQVDAGPGSSVLRMQVRPDMLNGFGIAHGGITYALADSALAFSSNSRGRKAVSLDTSINHLAPVKAGDWLTATATEDHIGHKTAVYRVEVRNQDGKMVALFKGTVYRSSQEWGGIGE